VTFVQLASGVGMEPLAEGIEQNSSAGSCSSAAAAGPGLPVRQAGTADAFEREWFGGLRKAA